jgi:hypothetical protein
MGASRESGSRPSFFLPTENAGPSSKPAFAPSSRGCTRLWRLRPDADRFSRPQTDKVAPAHFTAPAVGAEEHSQAHPPRCIVMFQVPGGQILPQAARTFCIKDRTEPHFPYAKARGTIFTSCRELAPKRSQMVSERLFPPDAHSRRLTLRTVMLVAHSDLPHVGWQWPNPVLRWVKPYATTPKMLCPPAVTRPCSKTGLDDGQGARYSEPCSIRARRAAPAT